MSRLLTREEARAFYDRFGARQDRQGWYENRALERLILHARLAEARRVFELGCGTGRFAARLLEQVLPRDAQYVGVDLSATMRALAADRLASHGDRACVFDPLALPGPLAGPDRYDRYLCTYLLDLLSAEEIRASIAQAHRMLDGQGLLGLVSLTCGEGPWGRLVTGIWRAVHARRPDWVGGCRPIRLLEHLPPILWRIEQREVLSAFGIHSEVVVAAPLQPEVGEDREGSGVPSSGGRR